MSNCSRCQFAGNQNESGNVECHRYPPPSYGKTWPLMRPVDWCGEWSQSAAVPDEISSARLTAENEALRARLETVEAETKAELEAAIEDAAKSAFVKAQSVYRADHDHFPLKHTWETTHESVREGWRSIAFAAVEAAITPPLGTMPEPRRRRSLSGALALDTAARERLSNELDPEIGLPSDYLLRSIHADLEMRGRKHPDFAVTVHHRNIVLSAVAAAIRNLEPRHD